MLRRGALIALPLALGVWWAVLFSAQRAVVFPAPRTDAVPALPSDVEASWLEQGRSRSETWLLPALEQRTERSPLIVYAHGNGELIDHWVEEFAPLRGAGISVLLVEYPGYGRSSGYPSERSIAAAFRAAYDRAIADPRIDPERVIGWGRSLGGGAICGLARERKLAGLVLESTFTSIRSEARAFGLPGFLVRDPFDNLSLVRAFRGPLLLIHGTRDRSIPIVRARELHAAAPGSELRELPCGHNDCPRPWELGLRFLRSHGLIP